MKEKCASFSDDGDTTDKKFLINAGLSGVVPSTDCDLSITLRLCIVESSGNSGRYESERSFVFSDGFENDCELSTRRIAAPKGETLTFRSERTPGAITGVRFVALVEPERECPLPLDFFPESPLDVVLDDRTVFLPLCIAEVVPLAGALRAESSAGVGTAEVALKTLDFL